MAICGNLLILQTVLPHFDWGFLKANWEGCATGLDNNKVEQLIYFTLAASSI